MKSFVTEYHGHKVELNMCMHLVNFKSFLTGEYICSEPKIVDGHKWFMKIKLWDKSAACQICLDSEEVRYRATVEYFIKTNSAEKEKTVYRSNPGEASTLYEISSNKEFMVSTWYDQSCSGYTSFPNIALIASQNLIIRAKVTAYEFFKQDNVTDNVQIIPNTANLQNDLQRYRTESADACDVTLIVENTIISGHKAVISARSAVLSAMLTSPHSESYTDTIVVTDFPVEVVSAYVDYLYTDKVGNDTLNTHCVELLGIAHKYQTQGLVTLCANHLTVSLSVSTVIDTLQLAELYSLAPLRETCVHYIARNLKPVLSLHMDKLPNLSQEVVQDILCRVVA